MPFIDIIVTLNIVCQHQSLDMFLTVDSSNTIILRFQYRLEQAIVLWAVWSYEHLATKIFLNGGFILHCHQMDTSRVNWLTSQLNVQNILKMCTHFIIHACEIVSTNTLGKSQFYVSILYEATAKLWVSCITTNPCFI